MIHADIIHVVGWEWWSSAGIGNASFEDAVKAVLKLATDTSVNSEILCFMSRFKADCAVFGANKFVYIHIAFFSNTQRGSTFY
jgi:hypothetical protein